MSDDATPPQWLPDPTGRHEHRYWDGTAWTEHVADQGRPGTDALSAPPQASVPSRPDAAVGKPTRMWRTFRAWPRPAQVVAWGVAIVVVLASVGSANGGSQHAKASTSGRQHFAPITPIPEPATTSTTATATPPPSAVQVATVLKDAGIPISYPITDVTHADPAGVASSQYERDRLLTDAVTATKRYDIHVYVFTSTAARLEVEAFWTQNLAASGISPDALPLSATAACGAIHVDLDDGTRTYDPSAAAPAVQAALAARYGPC